MIIGHRGASAVAPENTLAAFSRALDDGADGVELDVRLARDGVPVVIHDATLRRTGLTSTAVAQMSSIELATLNVGDWFNRARPSLAQDDYERQSVPTLDAAFQYFLNRHGVIYVELKTDDGSSARDLVQSVVASIRSSGLRERVVVVSFDLDAVAETKCLNPTIRTGALFAPRRRAVLSWRAETMLKATADCGADEILLHRLLARPKIIERAYSHNLPVVVWTVDDPNWLARAKAANIHALITNDPVRMRLQHRPEQLLS